MHNPHNKRRDKGYRLFRLVSGEYIVAKVFGSTKSKFFLDRPMVVDISTRPDPRDPTGLIRQEFIYLSSWVEHSVENAIEIDKKYVMLISKPDTPICDAYDYQKECEDTPSTAIDAESILNDIMTQQQDALNNSEEVDLHELINNIMESVVDKLVGSEDEKTWDENDIDKSDPKFGSRMDDWSPYPEDYFGDDNTFPPTS